MNSWKDNLEHEEYVNNPEYTYTGQFKKPTLNGTLSQRQMKHNVRCRKLDLLPKDDTVDQSSRPLPLPVKHLASSIRAYEIRHTPS